MNQEKVWDLIAEHWKEYRQKPVEEVIDFLSDKSGKVLDLGCGAGRNFIKKEGLEFYGVDFSKEMLKFAEEREKKLGIKVNISKSGLDKLYFKDNFFDTALFISALHCLNKEDHKKALRELFRVLKPGAKAIISVWDKPRKELKGTKDEKIISWKKDGECLERYYYIFKENELEELVRKIGFRIISKENKGKGHKSKNNIIYVEK